MNIFKKFFNMFKKPRVEEDRLSEILFDENFKSDGRKPSYQDLKIDVYYVEDNLKGEEGKRYIKTLKYDGTKLMENKENIYITAKTFNNSFESSSQEQKEEYIRQFNEISNF